MKAHEETCLAFTASWRDNFHFIVFLRWGLEKNAVPHVTKLPEDCKVCVKRSSRSQRPLTRGRHLVKRKTGIGALVGEIVPLPIKVIVFSRSCRVLSEGSLPAKPSLREGEAGTTAVLKRLGFKSQDFPASTKH